LDAFLSQQAPWVPGAGSDAPGLGRAWLSPSLQLLTAFWMYVALSNVLYASSMQASLTSIHVNHFYAAPDAHLLQHVFLYPLFIACACAGLRTAGSFMHDPDFAIGPTALAKVEGDVFELMEAGAPVERTRGLELVHGQRHLELQRVRHAKRRNRHPSRKAAAIELPRGYDATLLFRQMSERTSRLTRRPLSAEYEFGPTVARHCWDSDSASDADSLRTNTAPPFQPEREQPEGT